MPRSGRQLSVWLSHEEIEQIERAASREECSRNEAFRRAVRSYSLSPNGNEKSTPPRAG